MADIRTSDFGGIPYGNIAARPSSPGIGRLYSNGEASRLELYTSTGWQNIVQETPGVVSITGVYNESNATNTITINGTNFAAGAIAYAVGTNGVDYSANTSTVNSIVQLTAVFSNLSSAYEPYDIKVVNPSNLYGVLSDVLYINQSPIWSTSAGSLGVFTEGTSVSISLSASDPESTPLTYSITSGSLPSGISLNTSTGVISGTAPMLVSDTTYSFTVQATDGDNPVSRNFSIIINGNPPVWTTGTTLTAYSKNSAYSLQLVATDDSGVVTYSITSGSLPNGLTLNSSGLISGTPTVSNGTYSFTVRAADNNYGYTSRTFSLPNTSPSWSSSGTYTFPTNVAKSFTLSATDDSGNAPTFTLASGTLPTGITLSSGGILSGTATVANQSQSVTIRATDEAGNYSDQSFTLITMATNTWLSIGSTVTKNEAVGGYYNNAIWVGGGQQSPTYSQEWYSINTSTGTATLKATMNEPRDEARGNWVGDKFYVPGGYSNNSVQNTSFLRYDATANSWSFLTALTSAPVYAAVGGDGTNLYYVAGSNTNANTMQRYNVSAGTWTTLAALPSGYTVSAPHRPLTYYNGNLYLLASYNSAYAMIYYSIANNTWTTGATIAAGVYGGNYALNMEVIGSKIYVYGSNTGRDVDVYNITGNSWSTLSGTTTNKGTVSGTDGTYIYYHGGNNGTADTNVFYRLLPV